MPANFSLTVIPADTHVASFTTGPLVSNFRNARLFLHLTALSGGGLPWVLVTAEVLNPADGTWSAFVNPFNTGSVGAYVYTHTSFVGTFRFVVTLSGSTPSATFSLGAVLFD